MGAEPHESHEILIHILMNYKFSLGFAQGFEPPTSRRSRFGYSSKHIVHRDTYSAP